MLPMYPIVPIKGILLCFYLVSGIFMAICEPDGQPSTIGQPATEKEKNESVTEQWRKILRYGIEEEVLEVIKNIRTTKETSLNNELKLLFAETLSTKVKISILDYFTLEKVKILEDTVLAILKHRDDDQGKIERELIMASLRYLLAIESFTQLELYKELAASEDKGYAATAIRLLGMTRKPEAGVFLLAKLNDIAYEEDLKPELVFALGEARYKDAVEPLINIIKESSQPKGLRMYACEALGKIGDPDAIEPMKALFSEDDALIKSYAAAGLSYFKIPEVADILIQGLKDSNWKVRATAAKGLAAAKSSRALDILMYKAEKDPVNDVREESVKALGELGHGEGYELLRTLFASNREPLDIRDLCLATLLDKDPGKTISVISEVVNKEMLRPRPNEDVLAMVAARLAPVQRGDLKEIFVKLLASTNINIKIYAIRGIGLNRYGDIKPTIEKISKEDPVTSVKKSAQAVLEKW